MYVLASSKISAGVRIQVMICLHKIQVTMVMITAKTIESHTLFATNLRRPVWSFAPKRCATGIAKPLQTPMQKPMIIKLTDPVEPTAAKALTPKHLPTMIVSIIL